MPTPAVPVPADAPASERQGVPGHDQAVDLLAGARLIELRAQGMTYKQIADREGYADPSGARQALLRALDRHEAENAAQLRALENIRLDSDERVLRSIAADTGKEPKDRIAAVNARTRLAARRARLNGLDAPVQVALSAGVEAELLDALRELEDVVDVEFTEDPAPDEET